LDNYAPDVQIIIAIHTFKLLCHCMYSKIFAPTIFEREVHLSTQPNLEQLSNHA